MKNRREFIAFMGKVGIATTFSGGLLQVLSSCVSPGTGKKSLPFKPIQPSVEDKVIFADGFQYELLIKEGDSLNDKNFGACNDFLAFIPLNNSTDEGLLWANHEYLLPLFTSGFSKSVGKKKTKAQVNTERKVVGGSILHLKKNADKWSVVPNSVYNRRIDAETMIPFAGGKKVFGQTQAMGTLGNCAGGVTPWNTILSCEENYHHFYGEVSFNKGKRNFIPSNHPLSWTDVDGKPPEHYGWVVEVDLKTGASKKHTSMGRFAHEGATCAVTKDGRTVVYLGDDQDNECFYKFVASKPGSLEEGTLFVANLEKGKWIPLTLENKELKNLFKTEIDLKIRTREAAAVVGGTRLDRPEDCEVDAVNAAIYLCCTNNKPAGRPFGAILKFVEKDKDFAATEFTVSEFLPGGVNFACPDNLAFDKRGNLWMTSDIADGEIAKGSFEKFGNNALFYIPLEGPYAGEVFQVASAPNGAEFTGPCFSPDGETLFLSVQHPGSGTRDLKNPTSRWPEYNNALPKSGVIQISGSALRACMEKI